ncbi:hypothetical protein [Methylobacterium sp. Leaf106]|uniref:hypothetical protein n=1 Tax=Methylobacterium sp. Leaf106 TaxID=1736255 RepID=UPI0006FCCA93|nr:hypothetical protein [Methylobacterium sp. Leaf106]KQP40108.1 hypothetical protein ASF34_12395 [Methylobacterium sp. Leaf106]
MMQVAIDPSERRDTGSRGPAPAKPAPAKPAPAKPAPAKPALAQSVKPVAKPAAHGRMIALGTLGCVAVAGLSYAAYSAMGSLAGPQVVRPNLYQMQKAQGPQAKAADWPDLRDGVPALASATGSSVPPRDPGIQLVERRALVEEPATAETSAKVQSPASVQAAAKVEAISKIEAPAKVEAPATVEAPVTLAAATPGPPVVKAEVPRSKALPPIEPVSLALPPNALSPIVPNRVAAVIAPNAAQTIKARSAEISFASLPAEPARTKAEPVKPAASVVAKPAAAKPSVAAAKPKPVKAAKPVQEASAEPAAAPAAAPEPEQSEIFGLKVPSLAPAGRKIAESVEALGNAVKNLPNQF